MSEAEKSNKVSVGIGDDYVATVEFDNGEFNFFDMDMLISLAETFEALDQEAECRAIVLCSSGKAFCAGADFRGGSQGARPQGLQSQGAEGGVSGHLYDQAVRLFATKKPIVSAVHGAAVGGGGRRYERR